MKYMPNTFLKSTLGDDGPENNLNLLLLLKKIQTRYTIKLKKV